jgi:hypothetical protein
MAGASWLIVFPTTILSGFPRLFYHFRGFGTGSYDKLFPGCRMKIIILLLWFLLTSSVFSQELEEDYWVDYHYASFGRPLNNFPGSNF